MPHRHRLLALAAVGATALLAQSASAASGDLVRASLSNAGAQAPTGADAGVISATGRYLAFVSADDLTGRATGGKKQLYVRDLQAGTTVLASAGMNGPANDDVVPGDAFNPFIDISTTGRFVVFGSAATNLVSGDTNGKADVFRKDLITGTLERVSPNEGTGDSRDPSVSGSGGRVAYVNDSPNLVAGDLNAGSDVFVGRAIYQGWSNLVVSTAADGALANGFSERPSISADGHTVAFEAGPATTNLYAGDSNGVNDVLVKRISEPTTTLDARIVDGLTNKIAPVPAAVFKDAATTSGADVKGGNAPDISADGRYVVFQTSAALSTADANAANDIYWRDVKTGTTELASVVSGGGQAGNGASTGASVSADGTRVAFISAATDLISSDLNSAPDAFARTFGIGTGTTVRLSQRADATALPTATDTVSLSGSGGAAALTTVAAFAADDTNTASDVYRKELTPTDTTGPTIGQVTCDAGYKGSVATYNTTASDLAGIATAEISGTLVGTSVVADGIDTRALRYESAQDLTGGITFFDGAGNSTNRPVAETAPFCTISRGETPGTTTPVAKPRILGLKLVRKGVRVTISTPVKGTARLSIGRVVIRRGKTTYPRVGKIRNVKVKAGRTTITLQRPKKRGSYRVVASVKTTAATTLYKRFAIR